ncbi:hypothetical protein D3C76_1044870 [compost metagenome]
MNHMRDHIQNDHQGRCVDDVGVQQQERQRRGQEHQARQTCEKVQHGVGVANALKDRQAFAQQRVIRTENLCHAPSPANPLANMCRQAFSGQPRSLRNTHISRIPALSVQAQRGMGIFGNGFHGKATDFIDSRTP